MHWLLITTCGRNPGDEFARVGVQQLIRAIDPQPTFTLLDKESPAIFHRQPYDRAVICGMPLIWSHPTHNCWDIPWWSALTGWLTRPGAPGLIAAGVGSFFNWRPGHEKYPYIESHARLQAEATALLDRCSAVYVRDPVFNHVLDADYPVLPCPSIFAPGSFTNNHGSYGSRWRVCNLMPDAAHYAHFNPDEAQAWRQRLPVIASMLLQGDFRFVAHNDAEYQLARDMGWLPNRIFVYRGDPQQLVDAYGCASHYFGNRVHGAIVSSAAGAESVCVGYDSRMEAVRVAGGTTMLPSAIDLNQLQAWIDGALPPAESRLDVAAAFDRQLAIFETVAEGVVI